MADVAVREADASDSKDIFEWRNDSLTRDMSRDSDMVLWEVHSQWYQDTLSNSDRLILICEDLSTGAKVGVVRFDFLNKRTQAEISINLSPQTRGMGYAKNCLQRATSYVAKKNSKCKTIIAEIKKINEGSQKSFEGAGFTLASEDENFWQYHYKC